MAVSYLNKFKQQNDGQLSRIHFWQITALLLVLILVAGSGCFPTRTKIRYKRKAKQHGTFKVTLSPRSRVAWAWLQITGPNSKIRKKLQRGSYRRFRLQAGKSYRIKLRRVWKGRIHQYNRTLYIRPGKVYNISPKL